MITISHDNIFQLFSLAIHFMRTHVKAYITSENICSGVLSATNGKKMKTLCILLVFGATLSKANENDFEVVVKDKSYLER